MTMTKKTLKTLGCVCLIYICCCCVSVFGPDAFLLRNLSNFLLMAFSLALAVYFSDHIIDKKTRRYLVISAGMISFLFVLRGAKYIAFEETETVARHIWYLYYVPILMTPLLSLFAAFSVAKESGRAFLIKKRVAAAVTAALILCVITNDLHQLVFTFNPGFALWDKDYSRGPVFAAVYVWAFLLWLYVFWLLFSRCSVSASRKHIWAPVIPVIFGIIYLFLYSVNLWPRVNGHLFGEFPESLCISIAGVWLGMISIGFIPSNEDYGKIFAASDLAAQITDMDYRVIYRSANAAQLSRNQLAADTVVSLDRDTRLHRKQVHGGYVYWQDDISELNRINEELWELGERLAEEAELVRLENKLKKERALIDARTKAYDEIAEKVLPQSRLIAEKCAQAKLDGALFSQNMKTVCFYAAFIKRYANLSLLAADHAQISSSELNLAIAESLKYINDMGVPTSLDCAGEALLPAQEILSAYALFETLSEQCLDRLKGVQASLSEKCLKLVFEGAELSGDDKLGASLSLEDGNSYVLYAFEGAGGMA